MHKLIISDLDGTLLPKHNHALSEAVRTAIEQIVQNNNIFCVCSGRSYVHLKRIFSNISVPVYFICCDGALCVYQDKTLFEHPFPAAPIPETEENILVYTKYIVYASHHNLPFYRKAISEYGGHVLPISDYKHTPIYKIAYQNAPLRCYNGLDRIYKKDGWQEYVKAGVHKGVAVHKLQDILHCSSEETLILGDSENDLPMLPFGKSYWIGTGTQSIQKHFDYKAPDFLTAVQHENLLG